MAAITLPSSMDVADVFRSKSNTYHFFEKTSELILIAKNEGYGVQKINSLKTLQDEQRELVERLTNSIDYKAKSSRPDGVEFWRVVATTYWPVIVLFVLAFKYCQTLKR